jgi:hypothetical protein
MNPYASFLIPLKTVKDELPHVNLSSNVLGQPDSSVEESGLISEEIDLSISVYLANMISGSGPSNAVPNNHISLHEGSPGFRRTRPVSFRLLRYPTNPGKSALL